MSKLTKNFDFRCFTLSDIVYLLSDIVYLCTWAFHVVQIGLNQPIFCRKHSALKIKEYFKYQ